MKYKRYAIINALIALGLMILALQIEDDNISAVLKLMAIIILFITRNFIIKPNQTSK